MKKICVVTLCSLFTLVPSASLANYRTPAELLRAIEFDGQARNFSMELHVGADGKYASAWISGSAEGTDPQKMNASIKATMDFSVDGVVMRSRYEMLITEQQLYFRLKEVETSDETAVQQTELMKTVVGKWTQVSLDPSQMDFLNNLKTPETEALLMQMMNDAQDLPMASGQLDATGKEVANSVLDISETSFEGGKAYRLSLRPDFLETMARIGTEIMGENTEELLSDPLFFAMKQQISDAVSFDIKVDTDTSGQLLFGRMNFAFAMNDTSLRLNGTTERREAPVTVTAPEASMSMEELITLLNTAIPDLPTVSPSLLMPPTENLAPLRSQTTPRPIVRRSPRKSSITNNRSKPGYEWDDVDSSGCDALPGTALYLQSVRKGLCPTVPDSRPGRGSRR